MGERDDARGSIEDARERMSEIADELARRASPENLKARTKEAAVKKSTELGQRTLRSPTALAVLGGSIGAFFGALFGRRARGRTDVALTHRAYFEERDAGTKERIQQRAVETREELAGRAAEAKEGLSQRADETREEIAAGAEQVKERLGEASGAIKQKAAEWREAVPSAGEAKGWYRQTLNEQPLLFALGTLALGAAAALLFPVTRREHEVGAPLKRRARGEIKAATEKLERRFEGAGLEEEEEEEEEQAVPGLGEHRVLTGEEPSAPTGPIIH